MMSCNVSFKQAVHTRKIKTLYFKRTHFPRLRAAVRDIDWERILALMNTEQKWEFFKTTVCEHTAKYISMGNKFKRLK
ncbi:unnamed protein product [Staurois parvus]|uniref:Uncharacterized protein n=1 Tax=Staurois parvus TaxID=386267 RepID=A0ABN9C2A0_9NEOB|nr:unnamed protein product [Staurois parvus]